MVCVWGWAEGSWNILREIFNKNRVSIFPLKALFKEM